MADLPPARPDLGRDPAARRAGEAVERAAVLDLFRACPRELAARHGVLATELAGAVCLSVAALPGARMLDHVIGLGMVEAADADVLDGLASRYAGAGHHVAVCPLARPAGLAGRLAARGYRSDYAWVTFLRGSRSGPAPAPTDGLEVREVGTGDAEAVGALAAMAFLLPAWVGHWMAGVVGRPGWRVVAAFAGPAPVACGALYIDSGVAWLGLGGTLPGARGRGAQGAILAERLRLAASQGCDLIATETGAPDPARPSGSYRNILRAGFSPADLRPNLRSPA